MATDIDRPAIQCHPADRLNQTGGLSEAATPTFTAVRSLIVITLSSLGLWAAILWVAASLGSGWLW